MINDNTAQWRIKKVGAFPTPNMQGATASADGKAGTVPSPKIADRSKVLRGDGTWGNAPVAEALSSALAIANGGTGATTAEQARENLGITAENLGLDDGLTQAEVVAIMQNLLNRPVWATTLGDGSDGAFNPTANVTLAQGEYNYTSVTIPSGVTVTITKNALIRCQGAFINNGTISGVGTGGTGGTAGTSSAKGGNGEAGFTAGGTGGGGKQNASGTGGQVGGSGVRFDLCDPYLISTLYGGGGGGGNYASYCGLNGAAGGAGGAGLAIVAKTITNNGSILLDGQQGIDASGFASGGRGGGGGGGGGGTVFFVGETITAGLCSVAGGAGATTSYGDTTAGEDGYVHTFLVTEDVWK